MLLPVVLVSVLVLLLPLLLVEAVLVVLRASIPTQWEVEAVGGKLRTAATASGVRRTLRGRGRATTVQRRSLPGHPRRETSQSSCSSNPS